jgi:hypothetical protein
MAATILDGRALSKTMGEEIEAEVAAFMAQHAAKPTLAVVRAGENPASVSYAGALEKSFAKRGLGFQLHRLPDTAAQAEILALVQKLNADPTVHGIMVQEPLPKGIDEAGSVASFTAAGSSYATHGVPMIPFYIFYSMFGFQRTADGLWAAADQMSRGFLLGGLPR